MPKQIYMTPEQVRLANCRKSKRYRLRHPEKVHAQARRYRHSPKGKIYFRDRQRLTRAGISPEQVKQAFKKQKGLCALCRLPLGIKTPATDHCHETGKFRGLLHRNCNSGLGMFKDRLLILRRAVRYMERHSCHKKK